MRSFLDFQKEANMSLFTDFYELSMCASYFDNKKFEPATFDLFIRRMPPERSYFLFAGLEQVLLFLENIKFTSEHLNYLSQQGFNDSFLDYLKNFKFSGEVWAVPEGSVVFPCEPLIRITSPIIESQLIETFLLNTVNLQTMIATKASRVVDSAKGKSVVEFGLRREHGIDAGMKVARSSYIAGCAGTSNVLAGLVYDIPVFGTMAHSFVMAFENEIESFRAFAKTFPERTTLLIDTYDEAQGAKNSIIVAKELEKKGFKLEGVRLDSGDLIEGSKKIRKLLDKEKLNYVKIFASGDLDEYKISELVAKGAKIDAFGVGTRMGTSRDVPYTDVIYKLSEIADNEGNFSPMIKLSEGKITLPGRKQIYRTTDSNGNYIRDKITLSEECVKESQPLLAKMVDNGKRTYKLPDIKEIKNFALDNIKHLPKKYKKVIKPDVYPVEISSELKELTVKLKKKFGNKSTE